MGEGSLWLLPSTAQWAYSGHTHALYTRERQSSLGRSLWSLALRQSHAADPDSGIEDCRVVKILCSEVQQPGLKPCWGIQRWRELRPETLPLSPQFLMAEMR